jgi:hypothetical protein
MQTNDAYAEIVDLLPYLRMISRLGKDPDSGLDLLGTLKKEFGLVEVES